MTPSDKEELLPCPWCHGAATWLISELELYYVRCVEEFKCPVWPGTHGHQTLEAAIKAWNTRPAPLQWTADKPEVTGWYWAAVEEAPDVYRNKVVRVIRYAGRLVESKSCNQVGIIADKWSGPIQEPVSEGG